MAQEIVEEANMRADGFVEMQRKGSTIVQLGKYRIVITKPPFSDGWEITAVRPVKILSLDDYDLSQKLKDRIAKQAEGILIAGAPGNGKSTFAQALAESYAALGRIVKTVEAPRDLQLSDSITQYAISHGSAQEIHDVLLLSRPDHTIFDEMRNTSDFELFADMRLAGVGMIGVVHGTNPIDAIQRFIGKIELGVIPSVVDTVLFIKDGGVSKVFGIRMEVKVPSGMTEADLARPIVTITDFETGKLEYEIYSYGDQTVVIPVKPGQARSPLYALAAKQIEQEFLAYVDKVSVEVVSDNKCVVYVPGDAIAGIIGKQGSNIERMEKELGLGIEVRELARSQMRQGRGQQGGRQRIDADVHADKKSINFFLDRKYAHADIDIIVDGDLLLTAKTSKKGIITIKKDNNIGNILAKAIHSGKEIELRA
jgi:ATPase